MTKSTWRLEETEHGPDRVSVVTDSERRFVTTSKADARWLVNVLDLWQREYERKHEALNRITQLSQEARLCGALGVDNDGRCKRCGLEPDGESTCPPGFLD